MGLTIERTAQDIEKAANAVAKELAELDRKDVRLQEEGKHAITKVKKLEKAVETDGHARAAAETSAANDTELIAKLTKELKTKGDELEKGKNALEKIADGLKGSFLSCLYSDRFPLLRLSCDVPLQRRRADSRRISKCYKRNYNLGRRRLFKNKPRSTS